MEVTALRRCLAPRVTWLGRLARGLWPDRNPLRRATDRAEAAVAAVLVAAFLAGVPLAALTAGHWAYAAGLRAERSQQESWHRVPAVLLRDAPQPVYVGYRVWVEAQVRAWWTGPDGTPRAGEVSAPRGARAGSTVMVWTDPSGRLTDPPMQHAQVAHQAALAALLAPAAFAVLLILAWALTRRALDRRRLAAWTADWSVTGPQWTSRR
jgi:hypothetical protein